MKKLTLSLLAVTLLSACSMKQSTITPSDMALKANEELSSMYEFKPAENMQLYDAVAHTLLRNQDIFTKDFETQIASGKKLAASLDYLPQLTYERRNIERDRLLLSTSTRFGGQPIENVDTTPSFSSLRDTKTDSLRLSWDLLNVFKNFLTSKQLSNAEMISKLNREKVAQNTFRDVLPAYYLVNIKQNEGLQLATLTEQLKLNLDDFCSTIANEEQSVNDKLIDNCDGALASHSLVQDLNYQLSEAEHNLKAMMAVSSDSQLSLATVSYTDPGAMSLDIDKLVDFALSNRPELFVEQYNERNADLERKKAWMDILPGVEFSIAKNETDNPFIVNKDWEETSIDITWNIIGKVIKAPLMARQAKFKKALAHSRYRALLITTVTQVQLAYEAYNKDRQKWINSYQRGIVSSRSNKNNNAKFKAGQQANVVYIGNQIEALQKQVQAKADYVRMIDSLSMLYLSLGIPVTPLIDDASSAEDLAQRIAAQLRALSIIDNV